MLRDRLTANPALATAPCDFLLEAAALIPVKCRGRGANPARTSMVGIDPTQKNLAALKKKNCTSSAPAPRQPAGPLQYCKIGFIHSFMAPTVVTIPIIYK